MTKGWNIGVSNKWCLNSTIWVILAKQMTFRLCVNARRWGGADVREHERDRASKLKCFCVFSGHSWVSLEQWLFFFLFLVLFFYLELLLNLP